MSICQRVKTNNNLWEQSLISYEILRGFFKDKEREYYTVASELVIYDYWKYAHHAAKHKDKAFFEKYKAAINGEYAKYQYVLGYQNPFKKWFQQQYWVYGSFLRMRSFIYNRVKKNFRVE